MKRYFTGKACLHGHIALRQTSNGTCVVCSAERSKPLIAIWKIDNRDHVLAQASARAKERYWENTEDSRTYAARQQRRYRTLNPDRAAAMVREAKKKKPGLYLSIFQAHRAAEQLPAWSDRDAIAAVYLRCPPGMEVDHIVPRRGRTVESYRISGLHVSWNLQYLPKLANTRKGNRMRPEDQALCETK